MQEEDVIIPESFDWREDHPDCVQPAPSASTNCSSSYVLTALSAIEDRICAAPGSKGQVKLSAQEILDCDKGNHGCSGGYTSRVFNWGKRKGFIPETCYETTGEQGECPDDHMTDNNCRLTNNFYRVMDYCLAQDIIGIKKEILKNGPVIGQLTPYTDFLTYKEGIYSRTQEAFKFPGNHLVKVVGWETQPNESMAWIVENSWGEDWGDNGYAKIMSGGETSLDFYAIGVAVYPMSMADYYAQQQQTAQTSFQTTMGDAMGDQIKATINEGIQNNFELGDGFEIYDEGEIFEAETDEIDPDL